MVTFHIPAGPLNLAPIFPGVDFSKVEEYYLEVSSLAGSGPDTGILATTNHYRRGCCCSEDTVQLFYINYLGGMDMIIMKVTQVDTVTTSTQWKKGLLYPLCKFDGGFQRFNVTSNDKISAENYCFGEEDQDYLKELLASPNAWIKLKAAQEQDDDYIPVIILDGDFITRKDQQRHTYVMQIQFTLANDKIILRN